MSEDKLGVQVAGDLKVALRFDKFPEEARAALTAPIKKATHRVAGQVRAQVPRGPKDDLEALVIEQFYNDPDQVSGRVTFRGEYAKVGALEYGAPGKQNRNFVREHSAKLDHAWGRKMQSPISVTIAAHRRRLNIKARRFLRGSLASESGETLQDIRSAIEAVKGKDQ
jgi:hypothetical protein